MRRRFFVCSVLALALLVPLAVSAQEEAEDVMRPAAALDLSEEQMEAMAAMRTAHRMAMIDLRAEQKKLRLEMMTELRKSDPDRGKLEATIDKLSTVREKIEKQRLGHLLSVRDVLNDDQWKVFLRRHHGMRAGMGRGMMGPRGREMMRPGRRGMRGMRGKRGMRGMHGRGMCGPGMQGPGMRGSRIYGPGMRGSGMMDRPLRGDRGDDENLPPRRGRRSI